MVPNLRGSSVVRRFPEIKERGWRYYGRYDAIQVKYFLFYLYTRNEYEKPDYVRLSSYFSVQSQPCILRLLFAEPVLIRAHEWHTICVKIE